MTWCADAYEAATGADVVVLLTEWNRFRALDLIWLKQGMRGDAFAGPRAGRSGGGGLSLRLDRPPQRLPGVSSALPCPEFCFMSDPARWAETPS